MKRVVLKGHCDCSGIKGIDALGVFDWECLVKDDVVSFVSYRKSDKGLRELVTNTAFKENYFKLQLISGVDVASSTAAWAT